MGEHMRVISKNVTDANLKGFEHVGSSRDTVSLTKKGTLKAGKPWKGRLVSALETMGLFKEYCAKTRLEMEESNRHAAWTLWNGLVRKYGIDNAKEALSKTSSSLHGMDGIKARHGIISQKEVNTSDRLTCGEVSQLMHKARNIKYARDQQMSNLHRHAPMSEHEAAFYDRKNMRTSRLSDSIKNHQRVRDFVSNKENLRFLMQDLHENPRKLNQARIDYITARLLQEVGTTRHEGVFSRDQIVRLAERALKESLEHKASWSRMQAIKITMNQRMSEPSKLSQDLITLKNEVMDEAKATVNRRYVREIGEELGFTIKAAQTHRVVKKVLRNVEKRVTKEHIYLTTDDFKQMTIEALHALY
jgi:hypothetical protein